ncbi:MAG: hypothetical protein WCF25_09845, partial [Acidimicrobiales bacterium]
GASAWNEALVNSVGTLTGISCPSSSFCAAVDSKGDVVTSSNPGGGASAWTISPIDVELGDIPIYLDGISCPTTSFCAAFDYEGNVLTSTDPSGGTTAWNSVFSDVGGTWTSISCTSASFCAAVDYDGNAFTSSDPTGGVSAWNSVSLDAGQYLNAISCPAVTFCAAIDTFGTAFVSNDPGGGASSWSSTPTGSMGPTTDISCSSSTSCSTTDSNGDIFTTKDGESGTTIAPRTSSFNYCSSVSPLYLRGVKIPVKPCIDVTDAYDGASASSRSITVPKTRETCPSSVGADYGLEQLACEVLSTSHHTDGSSIVDVAKLRMVWSSTSPSLIDGGDNTVVEADEVTLEVTTSATGTHKTSVSDVKTKLILNA